MGFFQRKLLYVLVIMGGSLSFGLTLSFYSPAEEGMCRDLGLSSTLGATFNALISLMSIFTVTYLSTLITKTGRRFTTFLNAATATISWIVLPLATKKTYWLAFVARSFLGLTVGSFSIVCPLYITELAPIEYRGAYGILHQLGVTIGSLLCYILGLWLDWRKIAFISSIPSALCCLFIFFIPESPHHQDDSEANKDKKEPLCQKKFSRSLTISFFLMLFQQFSGINGFLTTLETIFKDCGISIKPSAAACLVGLSGMIATGFSAPLINTVGHRPAWEISSLVSSLTLLVAGLNSIFNWSNYIIIICMFVDNFVFGLGYGPIPCVITAELFPDSVRPIATSLMIAINWSFSTIVMFAFPVMQKALGFATTMLIFSGFCFCAFIFGCIWIPDTKGKEMGQIYEEPVNTEPLLVSQ